MATRMKSSLCYFYLVISLSVIYQNSWDMYDCLIPLVCFFLVPLEVPWGMWIKCIRSRPQQKYKKEYVTHGIYCNVNPCPYDKDPIYLQLQLSSLSHSLYLTWERDHAVCQFVILYPWSYMLIELGKIVHASELVSVVGKCRSTKINVCNRQTR